jgi:hypothetical protein
MDDIERHDPADPGKADKGGASASPVDIFPR